MVIIIGRQPVRRHAAIGMDCADKGIAVVWVIDDFVLNHEFTGMGGLQNKQSQKKNRQFFKDRGKD